MIEIKNICAGYDGEEKLHNVSIGFKKGEITVIIGPNGCGKSTLLKTMTGILSTDSGEIFIDKANIKSLTQNQIARQVAYLPQNRNIPAISTRRMVLHGRFPYLSYPRKYRKEDYEVAQKAMEEVGVEKYSDLYMTTLSGGERQKVYIAMAIAQDTPIVLFDEPTTFLDIYHQLNVLSLAKKLKSQGKTVIMVLHDLNLALQCADTLVVMNKGCVVTSGGAQDIISASVFSEVFNVSTQMYKGENDNICYTFSLL